MQNEIVYVKETFEKIINFVDYMADEGYINTDDKDKEKQILQEYQMFVKGIENDHLQ